MTARVRWSAGGEARILSVSASAISLDSSVPSPPGSRIEGTLVGVGAEGLAVRVRVKVHGSKLQGGGSYLLEGRPIELSREARAVLERLADPRGDA